jgi:PQQ-dependent catabolism-associated CXXCW motif protein
MKRIVALITVVVVQSAAIAQGAPADEDHDWGVAPTHQLKQPPYHAPTPREIPGGRVVKTQELKAMLDAASPPLIVDVASGEGHDSIAGALWLVGAGRGSNFIDSLQALLAVRLSQLSGGDKTRPMVFFCVNAQCWLSYNAALRAIALGYTRVYWYRGGLEAWRAAGLPLAPVRSSPPR